MGTLALGKGAEPAALEDADGRPVVRVRRLADERLAPVDAVTLLEPLEGSFHALAIATVVPHEHFRRFWD